VRKRKIVALLAEFAEVHEKMYSAVCDNRVCEACPISAFCRAENHISDRVARFLDKERKRRAEAEDSRCD
jgi:hypothetical protein